MELKPGYKQTEVGMIPEAWEVASVGSLATFTSGKGISVTALHRYSSDFPVPVFGGNGIAGYTASPLVFEQTVVVGRVGQRCGEVYVTDGPAWITDNALYPRRMAQPLEVRYFALALEAAALNYVKNRNDLPLVTQSILHSVRIPWPPSLTEQRAITEVVGDVDALLETLTRLITKKRDLKHAAMQQLLTGQTRLPGFQEAWEERPLGSEVVRLDAGVSVSSVDNEAASHSEDLAILKTSAVENGVFLPYECKRISANDVHRARLNPRADSILISRMNTIDLVGECGYVDADYFRLFVPDRLWMTRFRPDSTVSARWLSYVLSSAEYRQLLKAIATGTSGSMKNISKRSLLSLPIVFPGGEEQTAIAAVLSDMDAEIAALEQRLAKTRALKQGMMQELLTGRTRLV